jgi:hypothetical protein
MAQVPFDLSTARTPGIRRGRGSRLALFSCNHWQRFPIPQDICWVGNGKRKYQGLEPGLGIDEISLFEAVNFDRSQQLSAKILDEQYRWRVVEWP